MQAFESALNTSKRSSGTPTAVFFKSLNVVTVFGELAIAAKLADGYDLRSKYLDGKEVFDKLIHGDDFPMPVDLNGWSCTDPDAYQYQYKVNNERSYLMVQAFEMPDETFVVCRCAIDLEDYSESDIEAYVTSYYDSMAAFKAEYSNEAEADGIAAECIFESLPPCDYDEQWLVSSDDEAKRKVLSVLVEDLLP